MERQLEEFAREQPRWFIRAVVLVLVLDLLGFSRSRSRMIALLKCKRLKIERIQRCFCLLI